jgi:hypothetical protein
MLDHQGPQALHFGPGSGLFEDRIPSPFVQMTSFLEILDFVGSVTALATQHLDKAALILGQQLQDHGLMGVALEVIQGFGSLVDRNQELLGLHADRCYIGAAIHVIATFGIGG